MHENRKPYVNYSSVKNILNKRTKQKSTGLYMIFHFQLIDEDKHCQAMNF